MRRPLSSVPRLWRIVLIASLAVNLCVAGIVVGAVLDHRGSGHRHMGGPAWGIVRALPEAEREAVIDRLRAEPREGREARRAGFEQLLAAIRAEPFAPGRVRSLLAGQRGRGAARLAEVERAVIDRLATMSPEARADFADRLAEGARRR
jgi:uncharacterized membrane protein